MAEDGFDLAGMEFRVRPVGVVQNELKEPPAPPAPGDKGTEGDHWRRVREQHQRVKTLETRLVIDPALEELLNGLEDFSHIVVVFWPHLLPEESRKARQVHPQRRQDLPLKGVFSTCSPTRPNPILITPCELMERRGNVLIVQGLEALDGTPILDIKPYVPGYRVEYPSYPEWIHRLIREVE